MHSIFLITPKEDDTIRPVQSVYTQKITARLKQEAGLVTDEYINRDNIDRFCLPRVGRTPRFRHGACRSFQKKKLRIIFRI